MAPLRPVLDLLLPPRCLSCGRRADPPWCHECRQGARAMPRPACVRCGGTPAPGHGCWRDGAPVDATMAAFRYSGPVARAVVAAKVGGATAGWPPLGRELAEVVADAAADVDLVTWVPTEPGRRRARGVDHARVLADPVARRLGRPLIATLTARAGVPDRGASGDRGRPAPLPADAFGSCRDLTGTRCLLVDDVITTGATASRAASAVRSAGAVSVQLAVLARAGQHPLGARVPVVPSDG